MNSKWVKPACYFSLLAAILNGVSLLTGLAAHAAPGTLFLRAVLGSIFFYSFLVWKKKLKH